MPFADGWMDGWMVDDSRGEEERQELECEKKGGMQATPYNPSRGRGTEQLPSCQLPVPSPPNSHWQMQAQALQDRGGPLGPARGELLGCQAHSLGGPGPTSLSPR
jgi:hypothetical protein